MVPMCKSADAGNSNMPKRSCTVLPFSEKVCMYREEHSIFRVQYYPWFQASTTGLGMYPLQRRKNGTIALLPHNQKQENNNQ